MTNQTLKNQAFQAALLGLEYCMKHQIKDIHSADCGRYPFIGNCETGKIDTFTSSWLTGILGSVFLNAYAITDDKKYFDSATLAINYVQTLQNFANDDAKVFGAFHEETPQDVWAHPRDGLSGALGMLDYAISSKSEKILQRVVTYADWFVTNGMSNNYPFWTIRFDEQKWEPEWYGSFHSGSAYFMARVYQATKVDKYLDCAKKILDFYNQNLLTQEGDINVIMDRKSGEIIDNFADAAWAPMGWIMMHKYNDDFGALANLYYGKLTNDATYTQYAIKFLERRIKFQKVDGGFGPEEWSESIPSAAGCILVELLNARELGLLDESGEKAIEKTVKYLLQHQYKHADSPIHGAFHGMSGDYVVDKKYCNSRALTYAIMSLLFYSKSKFTTYSFNI